MNVNMVLLLVLFPSMNIVEIDTSLGLACSDNAMQCGGFSHIGRGKGQFFTRFNFSGNK